MHIKDKLFMDMEGLKRNGPITIAAFGDSITHGALLHEIDYETVYWNLLRKKILDIRNYVPVNVINAGIGGITASDSVERLEKQVLCHHPDFIIVCFGLNDVACSPLEEYLSSLEIIFKRSVACGADVIFMTPNMLNTYVADDTPREHIAYAAVTAEIQNSGKMDSYIYAAVRLAESIGVPVCDCYSKWKELSRTQDTTKLLINRINHPKKEMHELFAQGLFDMLFAEDSAP